MSKRRLSDEPQAGESGSPPARAAKLPQRAALPLPYDIDELVQVLQISTADSELLRQLAHEAVSRFDNDEEAIRWFDAEVLSRNRNLWWSIGEAVRSKQR